MVRGHRQDLILEANTHQVIGPPIVRYTYGQLSSISALTLHFPDPNYQELQEYFDHADKVLNLSKDCAFETVVTGAQFDVCERSFPEYE